MRVNLIDQKICNLRVSKDFPLVAIQTESDQLFILDFRTNLPVRVTKYPNISSIIALNGGKFAVGNPNGLDLYDPLIDETFCSLKGYLTFLNRKGHFSCSIGMF